MKRHHKRRMLPVLLLLLLPLAAMSSHAEDKGATAVGAVHEKVVLQVSDASVEKWMLTLTNARNIEASMGKNNVDVEIVAFGPGVDLLRFESELGDNINKAISDGVKIVACQNTMKAKHLVKEDMLSSIGYVQAGVVELINRQRDGWAYIRP